MTLAKYFTYSILILITLSIHRKHLVLMLIRHGARAPAEITPAFEKIGVKNKKQLTQIGKLQHYALGKQIKQDYFQTPGVKIQFSSSPSPRCVESMTHFLKGFTKDEKHQHHTHILPVNFFNQRKLSKFAPNRIEAFDQKHKNTVLKLKEKAKKYDFDRIRNHYCSGCLDSDSPLMMVRTLKKLSTIVACHRENKVETIKIKPGLRRILDKAFQFHYYLSAFQTEKEAIDYSKEVLKVLGQSIITFLETHDRHAKIREKHRNFLKSDFPVKASTIMFAHDGNLIAFLRLLEQPAFLIKDPFFKPPFASHIKIELLQGFASIAEYHTYYLSLFQFGLEINLKGDIWVRILYMDRSMKLRHCEYRTCTLKQFFTFIKNKLNK